MGDYVNRLIIYSITFLLIVIYCIHNYQNYDVWQLQPVLAIVAPSAFPHIRSESGNK